MNLELVEKIANAVLYEGYILYPYRPSAVKNRQRFNFGALHPQAYSQAQNGTDAWTMQTQCIVQGSGRAALDVKVRFLHLLARVVGVPVANRGDNDCQSPISDSDFDSNFRQVESLEVGGRIIQTWQEATEREINLSNLDLSELIARPQRQSFNFPSSREIETLCETDGRHVGVIARERKSIEGAIEISAERVGNGLFKVTVHILNLTTLEDEHLSVRNEALMRSFVSTHTILGARDGAIISLLDPPDECREAAAGCQNVGTYPVLLGDGESRDCMLSSPIILYDYPQIAPESAGDFFDGTEIDEMLTLRIMTLTDAEKQEMRGADEHARRMLERTESLPAEQMMKLHGAMKGTRQT